MTCAHENLRKGRRSIGGQVYLVTFTTDKRERHFNDWEIAADACSMLSSASLWGRSRLLAWTLMPDHWHGLIEIHRQDNLSALIGKVKGHSARLLRQKHAHLGWIWARAYHDHALRTEEELVGAARYIVLNAVRAGLVGRIGEYPFWDAVWVMRDTVRAPRAARCSDAYGEELAAEAAPTKSSTSTTSELSSGRGRARG
jgi:putative transposase